VCGLDLEDTADRSVVNEHVVVVIDGDRVVGRIFRAEAGHPDDRPWMWTLEHHERRGRTAPHQGHVASREEAMQAFEDCWESGER
jgi:hypothetical protein